MRYKVLYTDTGIGDVSIEREVLSTASAELIIASGTDEETLIREGKDCDGIMVEYAQITEKVLNAWGKEGKVKVVSRQGIGVNNIDVDAATKNGIAVANVPDYCLDEVADHTMALALNVLREIKSFNRRMENGDFEEHAAGRIHRMSKLNFCLYGFGSIARRVAQRAKQFGFKLYAYDPALPEDVFEQYHVKKVESLAALAKYADIFSIHVPSTIKTKNTINEQIFAEFKSGCILVNTARGDVVNEKCLVNALLSGKLAGAGLDVFEQEPPDRNNPLLHMENVTTTPHVSWFSEEADVELRTRIAENVVLTFTEGEPRGLVNKELYTSERRS